MTIRQTPPPKPLPDTSRPTGSPTDPRGDRTGNPTFQVIGTFDNGGRWDSDAGEQGSQFFDPTFGR